MFDWYKKWREQPPSIQAFILTYGIYLLILLLTALFVYFRLQMVRIPSP